MYPRLIVLVGSLVVAACYRPAAFEDPCAITCTDDVGCPGGGPCMNGRCGDSCGDERDASVVADANANTGEECFGESIVRACPAAIRAQLILPSDLSESAELDTSMQCDYWLPQPDAPDACVLAARAITITARVRFSGAHPVLLVGESIVVASTIDLSQGGAGSRPPDACPEIVAQPADVGGPAGGGPGGTFGTGGGSGGAGTNVEAAAHPVVPLTAVRGGCDGHRGGAPISNTAVFGGRGGGGIWMIATQSIQVSGTIHANASGGAGGEVSGAGGGGGGAGGLVGLEAPSIALSTDAIVIANGGGGGGGANTNAGAPGAPGNLEGTSASGGSGGEPDVSGGHGSPLVTAGGGRSTLAGGGGGGGGAGIIVFLGTWNNVGAVSPAPRGQPNEPDP